MTYSYHGFIRFACVFEFYFIRDIMKEAEWFALIFWGYFFLFFFFFLDLLLHHLLYVRRLWENEQSHFNVTIFSRSWFINDTFHIAVLPFCSLILRLFRNIVCIVCCNKLLFECWRCFHRAWILHRWLLGNNIYKQRATVLQQIWLKKMWNLQKLL